ncbi:unnamed protein product [Cyclocybe aegerita]|uniref:Uncharacterized protein n=1 Tax=Cyclocybe aegerita TaxID=1973307 RepID=A0A8S0WTA2_CYCAE|nr:unnamed protein product [Cyclocybe aegerita]
MASENGSEVYLTRAVGHGSLPRYRREGAATSAPPSSPRPGLSLPAKPTSGLRRKRSTDSAFSTNENDHETKRVLRQRTALFSSYETAHNRLPTKAKHTTYVDCTQAVNPIPATPSAGAISASRQKQENKSTHPLKPSFSANVSGLPRPCTKVNVKGPRKSGRRGSSRPAAFKGDRFAVLDIVTAPAILNVGHGGLASRIVTHTNAAPTSTLSNNLSIDVLDELLVWDMESLPSIPSPPDSPERGPSTATGADIIPESNNNSSTATVISGQNVSSIPLPPPLQAAPPFSTPIDDDALAELESDIPFPRLRTNVVIENMGVKKARGATGPKGRITASSILNRHVVYPSTNTAPSSTTRSSSQPLHPSRIPIPVSAAHTSASLSPSPCTQSPTPPNDLPPPLPLRTLCQNTPHPLEDDILSRTSYLRTSSLAPTLPSGRRYATMASTSDSLGTTHLGASDCELAILFPHTSHFEVWDMDDHECLFFSALLYISPKGSLAWTGQPLSTPDVSLIDIRCDDHPISPRTASYNRDGEYSTTFLGGKTGTTKDDLIEDTAYRLMTKSPEGITVEGRWIRAYARPGVEGVSISTGRSASSHGTGGGGAGGVGGGLRSPRQSTSPSSSPSSSPPTSTFSFPGTSSGIVSSGTRASAAGLSSSSRTASTPTFSAYNFLYARAQGWYLRIWIPIPTRLFAKRETRVFRIHARVWMMGDEERVLALDRYDDEEAGVLGRQQHDARPLDASTAMTVSHLRSEREMGVW